MRKNTRYRELGAVLPHKPPMILITRVLAYDLDARRIQTEVAVTERDLFYDAALGGVPVWVGVEYMAQSVAALSGIYSLEKTGEGPRVAFLLGTRSFTAELAVFKAGECYRVEAEEIFTDAALGSYRCTVFHGETAVAAAELATYKPEDPLKVIKGER